MLEFNGPGTFYLDFKISVSVAYFRNCMVWVLYQELKHLAMIDINSCDIFCVEKYGHPAFIEMLGGMKKTLPDHQQAIISRGKKTKRLNLVEVLKFMKL